MKIANEICRAFLNAHPHDGARALEREGPAATAELLGSVPVSTAADSLEAMHPDFAVSVLGKAPREWQVALFGEMESHCAAGLLRRLKPELRETLIEDLPKAVQGPLRNLLRYPVESVGATMDPHFPSFTEDTNLAEALEKVRAAKGGRAFYWFVTDREQNLKGVVSVLSLLSSEPDARVGEIKQRCARRLSAQTLLGSVESSHELLKWDALPVVDEKGRYLGALRQETVIRVGPESDRFSGETVGAALGELYQLGLRGLAGSIEPRSEKGSGS